MNRVLKTLLLWLLALTLPMQSFAMAVKGTCEPAHPQLAAPHHDSAMDGGHHHHMQDAATHAPDDSSHASEKHPSAACCIGAVILPSLAAWKPVHQRIAFALPPPASLFSGHIPEGLKRPPRTIPV